MKSLSNIVTVGLLVTQALISATTIPDIQPNIDSFGPDGGWSRDELQFFMIGMEEDKSMCLLRPLTAKHGALYKNLPQKIAGMIISGDNFIIKGKSETRFTVSCTDTINEMLTVLYPGYFIARGNINQEMPISDFTSDFQFTSEGDPASMLFSWTNPDGASQRDFSVITYEGGNPTSVMVNDKLHSSASYLPNGAIASLDDDQYSYGEDGRISEVSTSAFTEKYVWTSLEDGGIAKVIDYLDLDLPGDSLTGRNTLHFNKDNYYTYWAYESLQNNIAGWRGTATRDGENRPLIEEGERLDTLGNWNQYFQSSYTYNERGDLTTYTVNENYNDKSTVTITTYQYGMHGWPERIIRSTSSDGVTTADTTNISYEGLPVISTKNENVKPSLTLRHSAGRLILSRSVPKNSELSLFTVNGRKVLQKAVLGNTLAFPQSIATGYYFWELTTEDVVQKGRLFLK